MGKVEDLARSSRRHHTADIADNDASGASDQLAILYGMAENEALGELCSILEEVSHFGHRVLVTANASLLQLHVRFLGAKPFWAEETPRQRWCQDDLRL